MVPTPCSSVMTTTRPIVLAQMEVRRIREALARNRQGKTATARELGIDRTTLYRKIRQYGIDTQ